ncbi:MAG TPA: quinone-dependent dihydroorotate dehydrogenase [Trueperaceae bacterium]|nr:quinone-dependent dihydroorotate dehydrogenase [Trueperaceae bacterium]
MYQLAKRLLFRLEPERAHEWTLRALGLASRSELALRTLATTKAAFDARLRREVFGLTFPNPIGLAAGLDKDGVAVPGFAAFGFGALELGSVTALAQPGNPRPRLLRLPEEEALINRMGFNNRGAAALAERLADVRAAAARAGRSLPPLGVNVGKSRAVEAVSAEADYRAALVEVWPVADYLVINVSSPNTPGLRDLQDEEPLTRLLATVREVAEQQGEKPVLLKLSPDLSPEQLRSAAVVAERWGMVGLIATNTTVSRPGLSAASAARVGGQAGGLSGKPLAPLALDALRTLREATRLPIVSVGGVFSIADVVERLTSGATLVQLYTALIYRGPGLVDELCRGLLAALEARGLGHVSELERAAG